jgi:hypothetical protein
VQPRGATLGPRGGAALVALSIPPPPAANTGTLPGVGAPGAVNRGVATPRTFGPQQVRPPLGQINPRYMPPGLRGNQPQTEPMVDDAADPNPGEGVIDGGDNPDPDVPSR